MFAKFFKKNSKTFLQTFLAFLPMMAIVTVLFLITTYGKYVKTNTGSPILDLKAFIPFIICSITISIGSSFFQIGADNALNIVGSLFGKNIIKSKSIILLIVLTTLFGLIISVAEPDLSIYSKFIGKSAFGSEQLGTWIVKIIAGVGVGIFLTIGIFRIIFQKSMKLVFVFGYFLIFGFACFLGPVSGDHAQAFLSISFDTSGVTTGPATVPFVIAFSTAVASSRNSKNIGSDSFGCCGIMSIGPIITMLILCLMTNKEPKMDDIIVPDWHTQIFDNKVFLHTFLDVLLSVGPIFILFMIYNFTVIKVDKNNLLTILVGFGFVAIGLYIFLISSTLGFKYLAFELGKNIGTNPNIFFLYIVLGTLTGIIIILGEPAVQILTKQIQEVSGSVIKRSSMVIWLSLGVGLGISLEFARNVFWHISSLYFFIPIVLAAVCLTFLNPDIFVAIAFDSGSVASGAIAVSFVLPICFGMVAKNPDSNFHTIINPFGIVGMISMMPIIATELIGVQIKAKTSISNYLARKKLQIDYYDNQIIKF